MEQIGWFVRGVLQLIIDYFAFLSEAVLAVAGVAGLNLGPSGARVVAVIVGILSVAGVANYLLKWDRKGNVPQSVVLKTPDTPFQVLTKDLAKFLQLLVKLAIAVVVLIALISARE